MKEKFFNSEKEYKAWKYSLPAYSVNIFENPVQSDKNNYNNIVVTILSASYISAKSYDCYIKKE